MADRWRRAGEGEMTQAGGLGTHSLWRMGCILPDRQGAGLLSAQDKLRHAMRTVALHVPTEHFFSGPAGREAFRVVREEFAREGLNLVSLRGRVKLEEEYAPRGVDRDDDQTKGYLAEFYTIAFFAGLSFAQAGGALRFQGKHVDESIVDCVLVSRVVTAWRRCGETDAA